MLKHLWGRWLSIISLCVFLSACENSAPVRPSTVLYVPPAVKAETVQAWKRFNTYHGNKWRVRWNPVTGTPHRISGHSLAIQEKLTRDNVDMTKVGVYTITYNFSDKSGNAAVQVVHTVHVEDTTAPVINLKGEQEVTIPLGGPFNDPGATMTDCDNDLALDAGSDLDVNTPGSYVVTYFSTDSSGNNSTPVTRTVHVIAP